MKKSNIWSSIMAMYLGFALTAFAHIDLCMWQFYAIVVPVFLLIAIKDTYKEEGD